MPDRSIEQLIARDQRAYDEHYPDGPSPSVIEFNELTAKLEAEDALELAERGHVPLRRYRPQWARNAPTSPRSTSPSADRPSQSTGRTAPERSTP